MAGRSDMVWRAMTMGAAVAAAAALTACIEAPTLDECYSVADCPGAMACTAGRCEVPVPDAEVDGRIASPDIGTPDPEPDQGLQDAGPEPDAYGEDLDQGPSDIGPLVPDVGPPPADVGPAPADMGGGPTCEVVSRAVIANEAGAGALRSAAIDIGDKIAVLWHGGSIEEVNFGCFDPVEGMLAGDPVVNRVVHTGDTSPAVSILGETLYGAWVDRGDGTEADLKLQRYDLSCLPLDEGRHIEASAVHDVALLSTAEGMLLGASYTLADDFFKVYLHLEAPGGALPDPVPGPLSSRGVALAANANGPAIAVWKYDDGSQGDEVFVGAIGPGGTAPDMLERVTDTGVDRIAVDALVGVPDGYALVWRQWNDVQGGLWWQGPGQPPVPLVDVGADGGQPWSVAVDPDGLVVAAGVVDGAVRFGVLDPLGDLLAGADITEPGSPVEHPQVVVRGPGWYGVVYGGQDDGVRQLKWAEVRCAP